jgi:hypothetical protein
MQSGNTTKSEASKDEIEQLHNDIFLQIKALDKEIKALNKKKKTANLSDKDKHDLLVLTHKRNVLVVALSLLLGEKDVDVGTLEQAITSNPHYKDGLFSKTVSLVDAVTRIMSVANKQLLSRDASNTPPPSLLHHPGFANVFAMLPNDIMLLLLVNYLDNMVNIVNVAKTTRHCYSLFQQNHPRILVRHLLNYAALGEWDAAEKIWCRYPDLLACKGTVSHPGRYLYKNRTALQIAWMNEEDDIIEKMAMRLTQEEKQQQFDEIFPDGELIIKYDYDFATAKLLLQNVFAAICNDNVIKENNPALMDDNTRNAMQALHDYLHPEKYNNCQIGLVFDVRIYQEALKCYEDNFNTFGNDDRRTFWCIRVEEAIATYLSTGYLRPHCQGIYNIVQHDEKLKGVGCKLANGSSYFSFQREPNSFPGLHFYLSTCGVPFLAARCAWRAAAVAWFLEKLCRAKTSNLQNLCDRSQKRLGV